MSTSAARPTFFVIASALIISPAGQALAGAEPPPVSLRVVSFNLKNGVGTVGGSEFNTAGRFLTTQDLDGAGPNRGLSPDILLLQECNQASTAELNAFRTAFLPGYTIQTGAGDGFNYNATLIRPGIQIVSHTSLGVGGPRGVAKTKVRVPGALRDVIVYNAHFKSGSATTDQDQRRNNATNSGNNVNFEYNFGGGVNLIFGGDLNSNNNQDGTITNLFFVSTTPPPPVITGILNLPVETLNGAANPNTTILTTFPGSGSRLDYICLDPELAGFFDANANGSFSQAELNTMGFIYYSNEDGGLRSNGSTTATNDVSDHRPVVFDVLLPRDPNQPYFAPTDVSRDGTTTIEDLYQWEILFAQTVPPSPSPAPDISGDRNVDLGDRGLIRDPLRSIEIADITQ